MATSPATILQDLFAAFGAGDSDALLALFADDATVTVEGAAHVPFVGVHQGRPAISAFFATLGSTATPVHFEVTDVIESGDIGVAFAEVRFLVPSTGRHYAGGFALRIDVADGVIRAYHIYENSHSVASAFDSGSAA